jgi:hypothetical protein
MNPLSQALGGLDALNIGRIPLGPTDAIGGAGPTVFPPNGMTQSAPTDPGFLQLLLRLLQQIGQPVGPGGRSFASAPPSDR